ncbi:MAG: tRNA preQ1(34) S-adenosylmethionine ribosyltransferase-isomerase QueA, partial [Candidatus Omnitrophota bacterium]
EVLVKPGRRARINDTIIFEGNDFVAKILDKTPQGGRILQFDPPDIEHFLPRSGKVPLPPYIKREILDSQKYQTVYAKKRGAVAAPTAGLHFTKTLLKRIEQKGVEIVYVTLHCGLGTFRPVKTEDIRNHQMDTEWAKISSSTAQLLTKAKLEKRRIIAVGTTSVRVLESAAVVGREGIYRLKPFSRETNLYILPGYTFKIVDALITNFHTPCSTNLILASSFCGYKLLMESYAYAIKSGFRFYSFGDAMFIM